MASIWWYHSHQTPCQPFWWEAWPEACRQGFRSHALGAVIVSHGTKGFCKSSVVEGSGNPEVKKLEPKIHAECS